MTSLSERYSQYLKEKREYINAVKDYIKCKYKRTPELVFNISILQSAILQLTFERYMDSFPSGIFFLTFKFTDTVDVTKFKSMVMLRSEGTDTIEYEFLMEGNHIIFTVNKWCEQDNTLVIKTKDAITTIDYNLDMTTVSRSGTVKRKIQSIQLFR